MKRLGKIYMALVLLFLYVPIFVLIVFSFNETKSRSVFSGFTLDWYARLFHNRIIISSLVNTIIIAVAASIVSTVLGTFAAIGINGMRKVPKAVVMNEAAQDLGCSPLRAFRKVVLPEIMPGVVSGFLMSFTYSLDDFVVSYFTSGSTSQTLPITIYSMTRRKVSPEINALSTLIFVAVVAVLIVKQTIENKAAKKAGTYRRER